MQENNGSKSLFSRVLTWVIIGVLASIAIPKFASARERSYMATVILDLKNLASQQEIYHGEYHSYANNVTTIANMVISEGVNISVTQSDGRGWAATAVHDAIPNRQCGIYYGVASAGNASPATTAGVIACDPAA